jgi:uncharacterized membrane protein YfcA
LYDLNGFEWLIISICALLIGLTKTGIPGLGILVVSLMAGVFPARASTGIVLPMLMFADVFAVVYYRRQAVWSHLFRVMPWTACGVVLGYLLLGTVNDQQLKPFIGIIVLVMVGVNWWWERKNEKVSIPTRWWFAAGIGVIAGVTTMMANAAGSFIIIYLLANRLPKTEFIGTGSWYYLILNWFKVPFSLSLGFIDSQSLQFDLILFPAIAIGALSGIIILKHVSEKKFTVILKILTTAAALYLLL